MLVNLRHCLQHHAAKPRLVAWARHQAIVPREKIYKKLTACGGLFADGVSENLREGLSYSLRAATGDTWSGLVEFLVPPRGLCVTIKSLNNALAWLTIEGKGPKHDVQLWFSVYGMPKSDVDALEARWLKALERICG